MALKEPESMDECVYFTRRAADGGKAMAWVFREPCPACGKGLMGKPVDEKTGRPKVRAREYVCSECGHTVEKTEYEDTLTCNVKYTCQACRHEGEAQVPFKRKVWQGVKAIVYSCGGCSKKWGVTKKMKSPKKKKGADAEDVDDDNF